MIRVEHGDCLSIIPQLAAEGLVVDACVCDPPYHLTPTVSRFGKDGSAPAKYGRDGAMARLSSGFMSAKWDGGDIAFRPETWAVVSSVLRPGAFLLAFGGTRTYHRLTCAIEDAGFVVQDCLMFLFATGFPKRRDMLKPAFEPVVVARKPFELREHLCVLRDLLGQMATSQCGMATITALSTASSWLDTLDASSTHANTFTTETASKTTIDWKTLSCCLSKITPESIIQAHSQGHLSIANASPAIRFFDAELMKLRTILAPSAAELATSLAPIELQGAAVPEIQPIVLAYKPGGKRTLQVDECRISTSQTDQEYIAGRIGGFNNTRSIGGNGAYSGGKIMDRGAAYDASKGRWPANICHDGSDEVAALFPTSAGQQGDVRGTEPSDCFSGVYSGPKNRQPFNRRGGEATAEKRYTDDGASDFAMLPGARRSDGGSAARFFFSAKAGTQDRWGSRHPTVKPVELMKWLVALVTPPDGTVLDPFAGSGTTAVAALATGRNALLIERESQYIADIHARLDHYRGEGRHSLAVKNRARPAAKPPAGDLFSTSVDEDAA